MSEVVEKNFVVGILGDNFDINNLIGQSLGSPGTKSDILFYNRLDASLNQVFCGLTPLDYPERIKPLLQTLVISNIHILVIDLNTGLNASIGEILVAMDLFYRLYKTKTLIVIAGINAKTEWKLDETKKKIIGILETTSLKNTTIFELKEKEDYDNLKKEIIQLGVKLLKKEDKEENLTKVLIDHVFPVKGIGTVILGIVKQGTVESGQLLEIAGYESAIKKVIIRSIQKHDRNFKIAYEGDRVGLALKGNISPQDVSRDNLLVSPGVFKTVNEIKAQVFINQFFEPKEGLIKPGDGTQYFGLVGLKLSPLKFIDGQDLVPGKSGIVRIHFDKSVVYDGTELKGIITKQNRFTNKLRIAGYFSQTTD
ncbi:MAG: EF-Tu/IF-2/RF-3 family GTPase [Promethearchaeota archaeon]